MNASSWPMFLLRTLSGAEIAPPTAFKKVASPSPSPVWPWKGQLFQVLFLHVQGPVRPSQNNFRVGMKLEAVDRKNPYLICPATIGEVKGDDVFITFDGWRGAFDYWCKYDSRDIFPVGWCLMTNHSLQPPGNSGKFFQQGAMQLCLKSKELLNHTVDMHVVNDSELLHQVRFLFNACPWRWPPFPCEEWGCQLLCNSTLEVSRMGV